MAIATWIAAVVLVVLFLNRRLKKLEREHPGQVAAPSEYAFLWYALSLFFYPAAFVERGLADYGVAGEADLVFPELVSALERGSSVHELANVTTLREGKVVTNPTRPFIDDLDALPFPAFHLLGKNLGKYWPQPMTYRRKPMTIVVTSRGCPYDCSFCPAAGIWAGRRWRAQSAEYVGNLMEWLSKDYGIREICFNENTFALDRHRVEGICNFILKKRLNILWSGNVNARHLHADLLALMHRAGCWLLSIGIETGDAGIMSSINKPLDLAQAEEKIKLVVSKGIKVRGYFIVGHQEETEASVRKTIALAKRLPLYTANFSIFVPVPGSRDFTNIYGEVAEHAIGDLSNYANLGCGSRYQPAHLSGQRVIDLQRRAMFEFFLRPSQVGRLVRSIETFEDFRRFAYMGLAGTNIVGRSLLRKVRNPTA